MDALLEDSHVSGWLVHTALKQLHMHVRPRYSLERIVRAQSVQTEYFNGHCSLQAQFQRKIKIHGRQTRTRGEEAQTEIQSAEVRSRPLAKSLSVLVKQSCIANKQSTLMR